MRDYVAPVACALLEQAAAEFGTPYQLYDEKMIYDNAVELIGTFTAKFPTFKQFFAVKALPNPAVLQVEPRHACSRERVASA